jgi:predicted Zn-dependent protease
MLLVFTPLRNLWHLVRRRPRLAVAVALGILVLGLGGVNAWAWWQYEAAQRSFKKRHLEEAREHIQACLNIWFWSPQAYLLAARVERLTGHFPKAEVYLAKCNWWQGGITPQTQLEATMIRALGGALDETEAGLWRTALQDDPDTPLILETLAECYILRSHYNRAAKTCHEWIKREPDNPWAYNLLGACYVNLGVTLGAEENFRKSYELDPDNQDLAARYVGVLLNNNNGKAAYPILLRLQTVRPEDPDVLIGLARCQFLKDRFDEARQLLVTVLEQDPHNSTALYQRARLEQQSKHPAEAEKWIRKALKEDPGNLHAYALLTQVLPLLPNRTKDLQDAQKEYQKVKADVARVSDLLGKKLEQDPNNPAIFQEIGDIMLSVNQEEGVKWMKRALAKGAPAAAIHQSLASFYERRGDTEMAAMHRKLARQGNK